MRSPRRDDLETAGFIALLMIASLIAARVVIECMRFLERLVFDG